MSPQPGLVVQLVRVGPHAGSHRVALRAAVSVAVPLLLLWAVDRQAWSIYAAFGGFTSLYGRNHVGLSRLQMQLSLAVLLTLSVVGGVAVGLSEHRDWLVVPTGALVAGIGSLVSDAEDWHPPGPLFLVFAFAACASIPSTPADLPVAAAVAAATAAFAVLVGAAGSMWRASRGAGPPRDAVRRRSFADLAVRHVVRCMAGCLLAGALATAAGIGHPYWAMVSAIVPLAARELGAQVLRGVQRIAGTALGLAMAAALFALDLDGLALIVVIVLLQAAAELWVGRNYAIALIAVTPLALLMIQLVAPAPAGELLVDRGVETLIGAAVGILLAWLTRGPRRHVLAEPA
ncbi:FUSC family protein [Nocardioides campestrisoli]|uniref:FUSC family protein n=1 Tax=Nocardioides campestrisoli TaxID=2736757 RepID=UPI0015E6DC25|nr:FUSC family protein [Nocardioides campestrisoli]